MHALLIYPSCTYWTRSQLSKPIPHRKPLKRSSNPSIIWLHIQIQLLGTDPPKMILNVLTLRCIIPQCEQSETKSWRIFFLGNITEDNQPIKLNGATYILCTTLKLVSTSLAKSELSALFFNAQETKITCLTLIELGHPQPPTPTTLTTTRK